MCSAVYCNVRRAVAQPLSSWPEVRGMYHPAVAGDLRTALGQLTARAKGAEGGEFHPGCEATPSSQALLALDAGEKAKRGAQRVGISRSTVF
jgi:hypothetical protein